jgi:pyruvate,orthophosphate dikinase
MILADDEKTRRTALCQAAADAARRLIELFEIRAGPATIRLPTRRCTNSRRTPERRSPRSLRNECRSAQLADRARELKEFNPMLASALPPRHRLSEIAEMQARVIFEAAVEAGRRTGKPVVPEVMVPLIATRMEFDLVKARIDATAKAVATERDTAIDYQVGTMIELPRAALMAGEIAETAEFFSYGTNDLTQTTFGISRDDAASFLGIYTAKGILAVDPFVTIDRDGVGELVRIATARGRKVRPNLKLGICGEHGGDPASVAFCHEIGLDYVSCSPFRVPIARLAAAQAALGKSAASTA